MERCWPEQGKCLEGILANVRAAARFASGLPPAAAKAGAAGGKEALQLVQQAEGAGKENQAAALLVPTAAKAATAAERKSGVPPQVTVSVLDEQARCA